MALAPDPKFELYTIGCALTTMDAVGVNSLCMPYYGGIQMNPGGVITTGYPYITSFAPYTMQVLPTPPVTDVPAPPVILRLECTDDINPFADFTFRCPDGEFKYCRFMLYRIPYFKSMFNMQGATGGAAVVNDAPIVDTPHTVCVIRALLGEITCDELPFDKQCDLVIAADYYGVIRGGIDDMKCTLRPRVESCAREDNPIIARDLWASGNEWMQTCIRSACTISSLAAIVSDLRDLPVADSDDCVRALCTYCDRFDVRSQSASVLAYLSRVEKFNAFTCKKLRRLCALMTPEDCARFRQLALPFCVN